MFSLKQPPGHLGVLMSLNQQVKKKITLQAGMIYSGYQEPIVLPLKNEGRITELGGCSGALPWPITKVNGKLQQPKKKMQNH